MSVCDPPLRYSVYGVVLESGLPLNLPLSEDASMPTIRLERGSEEIFENARGFAPDPVPGEWERQVTLADGSVYMRWEEWLEIIVSPDGGRVKLGQLTDVPFESFEAYIANFAVCIALIQRGEEPLHSTVVELQGRAGGFLGPSGAGKSTLAAYLLGRGGRLVTDDMLRITFRGRTALAEPGPARLKLLRDAAARYLRNGVYRGRWDSFAQKLLFEPSGAGQGCKAAQLAALFWLDEPDGEARARGVTIERLEGVDLFKTISAATMNSGLDDVRRLERQFLFAARIAETLPVYRLSYPRSHDVFGAVAAAIDRCVR